MTAYLQEVNTIWCRIAGEDKNIRLHLDAVTVEKLQGLCPQTREDRKTIQNARGDLFPMIRDPYQRQQIW